MLYEQKDYEKFNKLDDAIEFAELTPSLEYHIVKSPRKYIVIQHPLWESCNICGKEETDILIVV